MLETRLYVSRSQLGHNHQEVGEIVTIAQSKNQHSGITGALIYTGASFAQIIEGKAEVLDPLMADILKDPRHSDVRVISMAAIEERRFGRWSMAYCGPSFYVNRHVKPLIDGTGDRDEVTRRDRLIALMAELAGQTAAA
jgi:hypothetical protein